MAQPTEDPGAALARRLRTLRKQHWPGRTLTQTQLGAALGGLSTGLISSWENESRPIAPPMRHLRTYARFFATPRSLAGDRTRLIDIADLTPAERTLHDQLLDELTALRTAARAANSDSVVMLPGEPIERTLWHFPLDQDIAIVVAPMPADVLAKMRYADQDNPDYIESLRYSDADALIELYGHIKAANPRNRVHYRTSDELLADDYTAHLVLIGGIDWNTATSDALSRIQIPVSQAAREDKTDDYGAFIVRSGKTERRFAPTVVRRGERRTLIEDVAHLYRGPNPHNSKRTVTILNGMFSRGTLGVVRALTDTRFRSQNEAHIQQRFDDADAFSVLTRVPVVNGLVVTPDWTKPENLLHEWSEGEVGGDQDRT